MGSRIRRRPWRVGPCRGKHAEGGKDRRWEGSRKWEVGMRKREKRQSLVNSEVGKGSWEVEMRDGESFDCGQLVNQSTKTTLMPSLSLTLNAEP